MRRTRKWKAAQRCNTINKLGIIARENDSFYEKLEAKNYFWFPKDGAWKQRENKPSTSVFEADDGSPTGVIKIRVMAHPNDLEATIKALKQATGFKVIEISESYQNRKGSGQRIYTTAILDGAK